MELRHLKYFITLAEELNFRRAAEKLHISQPPLSRQIQELENELGVQLFYRTKRYVELTNAGKVFLPKAYQILDQVEQAYVSTRLSSTGKEGELRIGFTGAIQDIIPTLKEYRKRYPLVGFTLKHMTTTKQIEALNERTIDIALISSSVNHHKIQVKPLKTMSFYLALPENHSLVAKPTIFLKDLAEETFIMTPKSAGPLYYETIIQVFQNAGFTPNITIQADDLQTVIALVASGMGITLTPSPFQPINGIVKRNVEEVDLTITGSLAYRVDNQSKVLAEFLNFLFE